MKRAVPIVLIVLAVAGVGAVGVALERTFAAERAEAVAAIEAERVALGALAGERLARALDRKLDEAVPKIHAAATDSANPFADGVLVRDGAPLLPRLRAFAPGQGTPALDLLGALRDGSAPLGGGPIAQRRAIARRALDSDEPAIIEATLRDLVRHQALHVLPVEEELPAALAALGTSDHALDPRFVRSLLYLEISIEDGSVATPLLRSLIDGRQRLTRADFDGLAADMRRLARRHGVSVQQLDQALASLSDKSPAVPRAVQAGHLDYDGERLRYFRRSGNELVGLQLDAAPLVAEVAFALRSATPLDVSIAQGESGGRPLRWLVVDAPRLSERRARATALYRLKASLLAGSGLLALLSIVLGALLIVRERRFVDLRERFLGSVSHELRTPLASVRLLAETLERRLHGSADAKDYPARIVRDIDGLSFLVENLLSFQRLNKGGLLARPQALRLGDALADLDAEISPVARGRFQLHLELLEDDRVFADPELLRLVLLNLGRNACLYNERDPVVVTVRQRAAGSDDVIEVEDNGVGIAGDEQARIFDDFYRGDDAAGRTRGTGLGLPLCRQVMVAHGGLIELERSDAAGSVFALHFPREERT